VDTQVEEVHFRWDWLSLLEIGERSAASSLSDIAAMGGTPIHGLVSFEIPRKTAFGDVLRIARGIQKLFRRYGAPILGGNISSGKRFSVQISVLGRVRRGQAWLRSTARPGDDLYVTGTPGLSALALEILRTGTGGRGASSVLAHWRTPTPRFKEASLLRGLVSAAIDVSDGFAADAGQLAASSAVDLWIDFESLPKPKEISPFLKRTGLTWERLLTLPGDDYELIFTARPGNRRAIERRLGRSAHRIGIVRKGKGRIWRIGNGRTKVALRGIGWDHLSTRRTQPIKTKD
jgi:thiamine-monophosphate kinase